MQIPVAISLPGAGPDRSIPAKRGMPDRQTPPLPPVSNATTTSASAREGLEQHRGWWGWGGGRGSPVSHRRFACAQADLLVQGGVHGVRQQAVDLLAFLAHGAGQPHGVQLRQMRG